MTGFQRAALMRRLADLITENAERLARVEVRDNGKLYREMIGQLQGLGAWYHYFAGHADKIEGRVIPTDKPNYFVYTRREPVGVVGAITPWNSPLLLMTFKLAPGLAAGCTFVVKPSEHSPASTLAFAAGAARGRVPARRVQRRRRAPAASSARRWPRTRASTRSRSPARPPPAARSRTPRRRTSTGSPWSWAASRRRSSSRTPTCRPRPTASSPGVFAATGQTCMAGSRVIVHESVHDELVRLVAERANAIKLGDPNDPETEMGPIANQPQYEKVLGYLETGARPRARRPRAAARPAASSAGSSSSRPLFTGVKLDDTVVREEVFGPVTVGADLPHRGGGAQARQRHPVRPGRRGVDQATCSARTGWPPSCAPAPCGSTPTACSARTRPFGGFGHSGLGRENGADALNEYTEVKSVWVELTGGDPRPVQARLNVEDPP